MSRRGWAAILAPALLVLWGTGARPSAAATLVLRNGDRISGRLVVRGKRLFQMATPYGRLAIPRADVEQLIRDDGRVEIITPKPPAPTPQPTPTPPLELAVTVSGASFWWAWEPADEGRVDPALRMELLLDDQILLVCVDTETNPAELPGALVNAFTYDSRETVSVRGPQVSAVSWETTAGRVLFRLALTDSAPGRHELRLVYAINTGTAAGHKWQIAAQSGLFVTLAYGSPARIRVEQRRGEMEFSGFLKRRMKRVETFGLTLLQE